MPLRNHSSYVTEKPKRKPEDLTPPWQIPRRPNHVPGPFKHCIFPNNFLSCRFVRERNTSDKVVVEVKRAIIDVCEYDFLSRSERAIAQERYLYSHFKLKRAAVCRERTGFLDLERIDVLRPRRHRVAVQSLPCRGITIVLSNDYLPTSRERCHVGDSVRTQAIMSSALQSIYNSALHLWLQSYYLKAQIFVVITEN